MNQKQKMAENSIDIMHRVVVADTHFRKGCFSIFRIMRDVPSRLDPTFVVQIISCLKTIELCL